MKNRDSSIGPSGEQNPTPEFASSLELKELISSVFAERRADTTDVLDAIEHALMEPIPDLTDPAAVEEYNAKMIMLQNLAEIYAERSDELKRLWKEIEAHIVKPV